MRGLCGLPYTTDSLLQPFKNLSYNYVFSGFQGLQPIVLKLGLDSHALKREAFAANIL
jgi:streptomycin 6-kinase